MFEVQRLSSSIVTRIPVSSIVCVKAIGTCMPSTHTSSLREAVVEWTDGNWNLRYFLYDQRMLNDYIRKFAWQPFSNSKEDVGLNFLVSMLLQLFEWIRHLCMNTASSPVLTSVAVEVR